MVAVTEKCVYIFITHCFCIFASLFSPYFRACTGIPGLELITPRGAMYAMIRIDTEAFRDIPNDTAFTELFLNEQNVMVLPGKCFKVRTVKYH